MKNYTKTSRQDWPDVLAVGDYLKVMDGKSAWVSGATLFDSIKNLEQAVINAAIERRITEQLLFPLGAPVTGNSVLDEKFVAEQQAVDALLQAIR